MLTIAYPWLLLLLPLPLLVWRVARPHRVSRPALEVPFLARLARLTGREPSPGAVVVRGTRARWVVTGAVWVLTVLATARPQLLEPPLTKTLPVRDVLLAVDLSGSMDAEDFTDASGRTVTRLTAVKEVLDEFLARREDDRVGLIFFGTAAFVQAPFTDDLDVCRRLLDEAEVRMAGPRTAFGDALGLAVHVFEESDAEERVLIALTDGNDTSSEVPPEKAADVAADRGIVIHTVAVGDPEAVGEEALDEETLRAVAERTGGLYSLAVDRAQLEAVYDHLDGLPTREATTISHRPRRDMFAWPLGAALLLSLLYHGSRVFSAMGGHGSAT